MTEHQIPAPSHGPDAGIAALVEPYIHDRGSSCAVGSRRRQNAVVLTPANFAVHADGKSEPGTECYRVES